MYSFFEIYLTKQFQSFFPQAHCNPKAVILLSEIKFKRAKSIVAGLIPYGFTKEQVVLGLIFHVLIS